MRVVQDSDDEFDDEVEAEIITAQPKAPDASAGQERVKDAPSSGTGSTESLKRAFAEVHRNHLQAPAPSRSEPQSSVSLPDHPSKRRKTSANISPRNSSVASPQRERVTYGKRSKTIVSSPHEAIFAGSGTNVARNDLGDTSQKVWDLPSTMQQEFRHNYEPNELFPEPSSTVPNATMTQQRLLDQVIAPNLLGAESDVDVAPYKPSLPPSIPWSELCAFTPAGTAEQSDAQEPRPEGQPVAPVPESSAYSQKNASQRSRRASSAHPRGSPLRTEIISENVRPNDTMLPPQADLLSQDLGLTPQASKQSQLPSQEGTRKFTPRQKAMSSVPNSEDDLAAIGLPKEQYVPRPSRSRSLKVDLQEPVDFSIRPEKAGKASRRRKTTLASAGESLHTADRLGTPQKHQKLLEMGFTPKSSKRALEENDGNVGRTVDWLVANGMEVDELARDTPAIRSSSKAVSAREPGNSEDKATSAPPLPESTTIVTEPMVSEAPADPDVTEKSGATLDTTKSPRRPDLKSPKVQVVIPSRSPQKVAPPESSTKKAKRRKTTLDLPEPDSNVEPLGVSNAVVEKKKGRGRPKKAGNAALPTDVTPKQPEEAAKGQDKVLPPAEANTIVTDSKLAENGDALAIDIVEKPQQAADIVRDPPPKTTLVAAASPPTTDSRTPEPSSKKKTESPASTGKVSYRVGLSKRARIAPLLRIVKK